MAKVAITESYLEDIADAIREKTGMSEETYRPSQMAPAIATISGSGGITPTGTINITENGTYNVTHYANANVNVENSGAGTAAISVVDTADPAGGTVRTITAVDISSDTVTANTLLAGMTAHDAQGNLIIGTMVPVSAGENMVSGSITLTENGNITIDVGQPFTKFLIAAQETVIGYGVKATSHIFADWTDPTTYNYMYVSTNNTGTASAVYLGYDVNTNNDRTGEYFYILNNCRTIYYTEDNVNSPNRIVLAGGTSGTCYGTFLAGIEYKWWAWCEPEDMSWLAIDTPSPSIRNFFFTLFNKQYEHGEFTLTSTPTNAFVKLLTMTNFDENNPPQGMIFIDKDFYQGIETLPHQSSEAVAFCWYDKVFLTPATETPLLKYGGIRQQINQTSTGPPIGTSTVIFDGSTNVFRGYWQFNGNDIEWKAQFGGNQYTTFIANRTYIWIVY